LVTLQPLEPPLEYESLYHSKATSLPSGEICGSNGPAKRSMAPDWLGPSDTNVAMSATTSPVRESLWRRSPGASATIVPSSACDTEE
jgi:hypothetical protein